MDMLLMQGGGPRFRYWHNLAQPKCSTFIKQSLGGGCWI